MLTGQINMKLQSAIKAFGCLCLVFAHGFPVSEFDSPKIIGPLHSHIKVDPGEHLILRCDALPNCDEDEALIYWLVNGTFPEESPSHGRIIESNESSLMEGLVLQKNLLLKNVALEDFSSNFSCVVTNAVGMAQKFIKLAYTDCSGKQ
ncbi:interleukin-18-binding protein-like [Gambusia affinis]|uniref:interleukin-18-binding protein-like n=1 Tax=Gambusia affinis TaxID=33528 RepID=UPI001CDC7247|nr:interleukin-18-binding protein-like [Gambusia affinis]